MGGAEDNPGIADRHGKKHVAQGFSPAWVVEITIGTMPVTTTPGSLKRLRYIDLIMV